jgi:hypothetical protein
MDYTAFIAMFPEFTDATKYPVTAYNGWQAQAVLMLNQGRLGKAYPLAVMLYVAHNLKLGMDAARSGGAVTGPMSSKSVGPVSASYDAAALTFKDAGMWNGSSYGIRLYQIMKAMGGFMYVPATTRNPFVRGVL